VNQWHSAVFLLVWLLNACFFTKTPWTPLQMETKMLSLWVKERERGLSPAIVWNLVLLMSFPTRLCWKDTDKGFFVCGQQPGRNLKIIWPYRTGVNREERDEEEGEDEDMREKDGGGKRQRKPWEQEEERLKTIQENRKAKEKRRQRSKQKERRGREETWWRERRQGERGGRGGEVAG